MSPPCRGCCRHDVCRDGKLQGMRLALGVGVMGMPPGPTKGQVPVCGEARRGASAIIAPSKMNRGEYMPHLLCVPEPHFERGSRASLSPRGRYCPRGKR